MHHFKICHRNTYHGRGQKRKNKDARFLGPDQLDLPVTIQLIKFGHALMARAISASGEEEDLGVICDDVPDAPSWRIVVDTGRSRTAAAPCHIELGRHDLNVPISLLTCCVTHHA